MASKCQFRKKDGGKCTANAQSNGLCVFHDPLRAAEGQRARRAGGLNRNRIAAVLPVDTPDQTLESTADVARFLGDSINQLRRGQLDPRVANAVSYMASVLLRALEQGPMEQRLANLEAILGRNGSTPDIFEFSQKETFGREQHSETHKGH
jgi:hypothetical protein